MSRENDRNCRMDTGQTAPHSGSRYADKNGGRTAPHSGSRYADKNGGRTAPHSEGHESHHADQSGGSRYADKNDGQATPRSGSHHTEKSGGSRYADKNPEIAAATASGLSRENKKVRGTKTLRQAAAEIRRDPVKIALLSLAAVTVIAYVVVAVYFSGHFYPGAMIYGIDCSRKTAGQAKEEVKEKIGSYVLTIEERQGMSDTISASQINLQYEDKNGIEQKLKSQKSYLWPVMMALGNSGEVAVDTVYDRDSIDAVLRQLNCFLPGNVIAPEDAHRGDTDEGYEVVAEVMGTTLDYEKTKSVIMDALDGGLATVSLDAEGCYIDPSVYQDDPELNAEVEELNSLLTARITYDFGDRQEVVDASVIKQWIFKNDEGDYYIDDNHIWAYVEELAAKYDTFGGERTFYTSIGTVETLYGGDYGWCMDQDATAEILAEAVKEGKTETLEPEYIYTAMSRDTNDIGGTYVEVCISRQEMWCYQDGYLVVDTPVVTGNPNRGNATPSGGVWAIDAKMRDYTLVGEGYAAPVDYWMPFNGDVGIHDMQNRAYFGGTIYLSNGSHGCVNTPYEQARTIYGIVSIGTPVVVYE